MGFEASIFVITRTNLDRRGLAFGASRSSAAFAELSGGQFTLYLSHFVERWTTLPGILHVIMLGTLLFKGLTINSPAFNSNIDVADDNVESALLHVDLQNE